MEANEAGRAAEGCGSKEGGPPRSDVRADFRENQAKSNSENVEV